MDTEERARKAKERVRKDRTAKPPDLGASLSSGSCLLNLACTGRPDAAFVPGNYYFFVGDTNSGKSFVCLTAFAEAARNPGYAAHRLVYDNGEKGAQMDLAKFFGKAMASRLEPACTKKGRMPYSTTIEEFYDNLDDALDAGPCVYVLDSMDVLSSEQEAKDWRKTKKTLGGKEAASGSYGDGKAKKNAQHLRQVLPRLDATSSVLIVIDQTRDNVGAFSFDKKTRSGGRALSFYAQVEVWSSVRSKLKREVNDRDRHVGNLCEFHVKRSRFTGREVKVDVPIYFSAGLDDVGSCIDYLVGEGTWVKSAGRIDSGGLFEPKGREDLVRLIEESGREGELFDRVVATWREVEKKCEVLRKRRYD